MDHILSLLYALYGVQNIGPHPHLQRRGVAAVISRVLQAALARRFDGDHRRR